MDTAAIPTAFLLVQNFLSLKAWKTLSIVIMLLMLQDIHPNIIHELLPYFRLKRREVRNIILAMMQLRLFSSSFLPNQSDLSHRSDPRHQSYLVKLFNCRRRQLSNFRSRIFGFLLKNNRFESRLEYTGHSVRDFISSFVVFRTNPIFPIGQLFISSDDDLFCLKTACDMICLFKHVRSSYPKIVSFLAQNQENLQMIIMLWKTQMKIYEKEYYKRGKYTHERYTGNITYHPIYDLFVFCMLTITHPEFIDGRLMKYIHTFGDRIELPEDSCDLKYTTFFKENCVTWSLQFLGFDRIKSVIDAFSKMYNSEGPHGSKYELKPSKDDPQFECLTREVERQYPILRVFTEFLNLFLKNFARTFEESGGSALPP
jgi:hypothetical protein